MVKTETVEQHKDIKDFDFDMLKKVLKVKHEYAEKTHSNRKELVILRGDVAIKVIDAKDTLDDKKHKRKMKILMLK